MSPKRRGEQSGSESSAGGSKESSFSSISFGAASTAMPPLLNLFQFSGCWSCTSMAALHSASHCSSMTGSSQPMTR